MALADPKVFMEAMLSEMRRVMKLELEQIHERLDQMESARERQPQNVPNLRRRERVQPREVRVEDEEPYRAGFDEEDDRDSVAVQATDLVTKSYQVGPSNTAQDAIVSSGSLVLELLAYHAAIDSSTLSHHMVDLFRSDQALLEPSDFIIEDSLIVHPS
ncbi:hypothetical protein F0562_017932 [Nyssa sinensis]|uniref:Uncharacterized protein n=1 Tax=Nyssa sinensis TaxID=561372 RepID=A0A5J4Z7W5_9ASTE|nr:hypothetical protein F0562_017932 [Nyssa sinensis]